MQMSKLLKLWRLEANVESGLAHFSFKRLGAETKRGEPGFNSGSTCSPAAPDHEVGTHSVPSASSGGTPPPPPVLPLDVISPPGALAAPPSPPATPLLYCRRLQLQANSERGLSCYSFKR